MILAKRRASEFPYATLGTRHSFWVVGLGFRVVMLPEENLQNLRRIYCIRKPSLDLHAKSSAIPEKKF